VLIEAKEKKMTDEQNCISKIEKQNEVVFPSTQPANQLHEKSAAAGAHAVRRTASISKLAS
jgi:hypothetical protein